MTIQTETDKAYDRGYSDGRDSVFLSDACAKAHQEGRAKAFLEVKKLLSEHRQSTGLNPYFNKDQIDFRYAYNSALDDVLDDLESIKI